VTARLYPSAPDAPTLVLAHGAGAGHDHPWMKRIAKGMADRGVRVATFDFPYRAEQRKMPDRAPVLEQAYETVWREVWSEAGGRLFAGGKSMGGRIASQVAARAGFEPRPAGLVFFGYPLHPPGKPQQRRDRHLPDIDVPMLFLHGTRDPFATPDEMRELVAGLPMATLAIVEGGDHSLVSPRRFVLKRNPAAPRAICPLWRGTGRSTRGRRRTSTSRRPIRETRVVAHPPPASSA
jgi:predicted alpha/beta-hydrolase family hydrolase